MYKYCTSVRLWMFMERISKKLKVLSTCSTNKRLETTGENIWCHLSPSPIKMKAVFFRFVLITKIFEHFTAHDYVRNVVRRK